MKRKRTTTRRTEPQRPADLTGLLGDVPDCLHAEPRDKLVNLLVSEAEREEMRRTAKELGLTLSGYLRALHRTALDRMRSTRRKRS